MTFMNVVLPKRPLNMYTLFVKDMHAQYRQANPEASFGEISMICSEVWGNLPPGEKQQYKERAEILKQEYLVKMQEAQLLLQNAINTNTVAKPKKVKTRRRKSAYNFFDKDVRSSIRTRHPDYTFGEQNHELSIMWKAMSEENKAKYYDMAAKSSRELDMENEESSQADPVSDLHEYFPDN